MLKKILLLSGLFYTCLMVAQFTRTTVEVASKLKYPQEIIALRNKVTDYLTERKAHMILDVLYLNSQNRTYRANYTENSSEDALDYISERFDREFERISRKFVMNSDVLDKEDAPIKEKSAFVNAMKTEASDSINRLLNQFKSLDQAQQPMYKAVPTATSGYF